MSEGPAIPPYSYIQQRTSRQKVCLYFSLERWKIAQRIYFCYFSFWLLICLTELCLELDWLNLCKKGEFSLLGGFYQRSISNPLQTWRFPGIPAAVQDVEPVYYLLVGELKSIHFTWITWTISLLCANNIIFPIRDGNGGLMLLWSWPLIEYMEIEYMEIKSAIWANCTR